MCPLPTNYGTMVTMRIHFACSASGIPKYKNNYLEICKLIKAFGHNITRDWLDEAIKHLDDKELHPVDWKEIFHEISKSVLASDAAIFENTVSSFSTGYQLSLALERRKPILMLYAKGAKKRDYKDTFAAGIESDLITLREYTPKNLKIILSDFFTKAQKGGEKIRFNFFIDKNIENYLDWATFTYKKSKADILRELVNDQMLRGDLRYKDYLKSLR